MRIYKNLTNEEVDLENRPVLRRQDLGKVQRPKPTLIFYAWMLVWILLLSFSSMDYFTFIKPSTMYDCILKFSWGEGVKYKNKTTDQMLDLVKYFQSLKEYSIKKTGIDKISYNIIEVSQ